MVADYIDSFMIEKGLEFSATVIWKDPDGNVIDFTGKNAKCTFKTLTSDSVPLFTLTEGSGLTVVKPEGKIDIILGAVSTASITSNIVNIDLWVENPSDEDDKEGILYGPLKVRVR